MSRPLAARNVLRDPAYGDLGPLQAQVETFESGGAREAVRALGDDEASLLAIIARQDSDARVRRLAVKRIVDADVLSDVAAHDPDESLRKAAIEKAEEVLLSSAVAGDDHALEALAKLNHPRLLSAVALKSSIADAAAACGAGSISSTVADDKALAEVIKQVERRFNLRKTIVAWVTDASTLRVSPSPTPARRSRRLLWRGSTIAPR